MKITVDLSDELVQHGLELGGQPSEEVLVSEAVREYVDKRTLNGSSSPEQKRASNPSGDAEGDRKRQALIELFGTIDYYPDYDYKAHR